MYAFLSNRSLTITVAGLILFVFFSFTARQFLTANNLLNIVRNVSLIGIVAVGMTYVLVAGEIDLSVGSAYGVLIVIMGLLVSGAGIDPWLATLVVMGLGAVIGTLNGTLVTRFGIPSFIVTLAMLTAYRSAALILSGQKPSVTQGDGLFYTLTGGSTRSGALAHRVDAGGGGDRRRCPLDLEVRLPRLRHRRQRRGGA